MWAYPLCCALCSMERFGLVKEERVPSTYKDCLLLCELLMANSLRLVVPPWQEKAVGPAEEAAEGLEVAWVPSFLTLPYDGEAPGGRL